MLNTTCEYGIYIARSSAAIFANIARVLNKYLSQSRWFTIILYTSVFAFQNNKYIIQANRIAARIASHTTEAVFFVDMFSSSSVSRNQIQHDSNEAERVVEK